MGVVVVVVGFREATSAATPTSVLVPHLNSSNSLKCFRFPSKASRQLTRLYPAFLARSGVYVVNLPPPLAMVPTRPGGKENEKEWKAEFRCRDRSCGARRWACRWLRWLGERTTIEFATDAAG